MKEVYEQKCPRCQAPLRFDTASGKMVCDWCGYSQTVEELNEEKYGRLSTEDGQDQEQVTGFDFDAIRHQTVSKEELPVYHCQSCGAELISDWEQISLTCPYCQNNIVLTDKISGGLRPDSLLPFEITPEELPGAVRRYYKNKKLLPRDFFSKARMGRVTGLYVPFWVFDGRLSGEVTFSGQIVTSFRDGDYDVTETSNYELDRNIALDFEGLPVDASVKTDDALMDSLEPFDLKKARPFDKAYLAGFAADRFDSEPEDITAKAKKRMMNTAYAAARSKTEGYSSVQSKSGNIMADVKAKYMLLPVYLFNIQYGGTDYAFAVNGQTGKTAGRLPDGKALRFKYFMVRFAALLLIVLGWSFIKYMLGR